jgi:hypothetical protein
MWTPGRLASLKMLHAILMNIYHCFVLPIYFLLRPIHFKSLHFFQVFISLGSMNIQSRTLSELLKSSLSELEDIYLLMAINHIVHKTALRCETSGEVFMLS